MGRRPVASPHAHSPAADRPCSAEDAAEDGTEAALSAAQQAGRWRAARAGPRTDAAERPDAAGQSRAWRDASAAAAKVAETPVEPQNEGASVGGRARGLLGFALGGRRGRQSA
jgi:hypothetical protein